ncbi:hypothetical protein [endosymbiont GvMRE of Glomus versiforme]|uniref:hypothetical protein n=1 Tax=endosymbiont GvMRE of Glomus versiforme TaxID=2039283 RepID=UPI000EBC4AA2|nr:hypothetical protein [endosymbiont GvMRE of Glomus versiforme]RHZ36496.1 hypothetical protein GvMRE_I2g472 [endosymbiont GvMRE of Glomus versiforme]
MKKVEKIIAHLKEVNQELENNENLKKLEQELTKKEQIKEKLIEISKYGNYRSFELTEEAKGDDILLVSVPREEQKKRVNTGTLNNLIRQINIIFAHFDCPFPDTGFSDDEKVKLVTSILGNKSLSREEILESVDATNREKDEKWEENDPQVNKEKGITEPKTHSYEWFKRWWKFHQQFPRVEFAYGSGEEDFVDYPVLQEFPITEGKIEGENNTSYTKYRDPVRAIKDKKMYENRDWIEKHLFNPETKGKYLFIQSYLDTVPGQEMLISPYKDFYAADFIKYFHTVFSHLDYNSLLYRRLKPEEMCEKYKYDILHMVTWQPKLGKENSRDYYDHETKAIKGTTNSLDGWNYLSLEDEAVEKGYVHRFTDIKPGVEGLVEVVENIFYKNEILATFIKQMASQELSKDDQIVTDLTNIYVNNLQGKIPTNYQAVDNEIKRLKGELEAEEWFKKLPQESKEVWDCLFSGSSHEKDKSLEQQLDDLQIQEQQTQAQIKQVDLLLRGNK